MIIHMPEYAKTVGYLLVCVCVFGVQSKDASKDCLKAFKNMHNEKKQKKNFSIKIKTASMEDKF